MPAVTGVCAVATPIRLSTETATRNLLVALLVLLFLVVALFVRNTLALLRASRLVEHTLEVQRELEALGGSVVLGGVWARDST